MTTATSRSKGIAFSLSANFFFSLMVVQLGFLQQSSTATSVLSRFGIGLFVVIIGVQMGHWKITVINRPLLLFRGIAGGASMILSFIALKHIGIGRSTMIIHTYPIFASIGAVIFLGESISKAKIFSAVIALIGVYILISEKMSGGETIIWDLVALSAAIVSALAIVSVRKLHETDTTISIFAAQCIVGVVIGFFPGVTGYATIPAVEIGILISVGACATIGQLFMTTGFKHLSASTGSLLGMMVPVVNAIMGALIFKESIGVRGIIALCCIVIATYSLITEKE